MNLPALLGDYANTRALKQGSLTSPLVRLAFADVTVPNTAFKRVVRDLEFEVAELALMTFLMARALGTPLILMPVVLFSRNPLQYLVCNAARGRLGPGELAGRRVGVRSYTTTTAVWIRGLLAECFGVDTDRIEWITFEDSHVAEFVDPPCVRRISAGGRLADMLLAGEIDAAIVDPVPADSAIVPVVAEHERVLADWQRRHGALTINHIVVVGEPLAGRRPDVVGEVFRLFRESRAAAGAAADLSSVPIGAKALQASLEVAVEYAWRQGLLARPLSVGELFNEVTAALD